MIGTIKRWFLGSDLPDIKPLEIPESRDIDEKLQAARKKHVEAAASVVQASRRDVTEAEFIRQTVRGVIHRAEKAERGR